MRTLILHLGHTKTGSSFIQSSLASSQDELAACGIGYPYHSSFTLARQGHITSGNLRVTGDWHETVIQALETSKFDTILYSNEKLFRLILDHIEWLDSLSSNYSVKLILFIRNPLSDVISHYVQLVKRAGYTGTLNEFIATSKYRRVASVRNLLSALSKTKINIQIRNYSYVSHKLLIAFEEAMGLKRPHTLEMPKVQSVNRSMTRSELFIQRLFNYHMGAESSQYVSDKFCNELPEIQPETPNLSFDCYADFRSRVANDIERANRFIESSHAYQLEPYPTSMQSPDHSADSQNYVFSQCQLEVLAASLSSELRKHGRRLISEAHALRDQALEIEKNRHGDMKSARVLMLAAYRLHPDCPSIKRKLEEYDQRLAN